MYIEFVYTAFTVDDAEDLGGPPPRSLYRWADIEQQKDTGEVLQVIAQAIRDRDRDRNRPAPAPSPDEGGLAALPTDRDAGIWRVRVEVCTPDSFSTSC